MHGARKGVELGVVLACSLAEPARSGRKLVPEAIEIDALTSRDQALHVGPAKTEMPEQRVFKDLLPWPDAGERRVDESKARDTGGILSGQRIADHVADIVRHKVGVCDAQFVEHPCHIGGLRLLIEA